MLPSALCTAACAAMVLVAGLMAGCGSEPEETPDAPSPRQTLLFVDRSASTGAYPEAEALFSDSLRRLIRTRMRRPGDRLSLFVVHQKTLSKSPRLDLRNEVAVLEDKAFADEQALETARFKKELEQEFRRLEDEASAFIDGAGRGSFAKWTDLWGTLGVASEELKPDTDAALYYFSDMFESMPGADRRDFYTAVPSGRAEAEAWAEADVDKLPNLMVLDRDRLRPVSVRVLMGPLATKSGAQPVKFYWLRFFDALGITTVDYN
jgi:hypothetical protein